MKLPVLFVAMTVALVVAGEAEACRVYQSPMITYDRWFEGADEIVLGRVTSVGQVQEAEEGGRFWMRPVMEVEPTRVLRGTPSLGLISLRGEDIVTNCQPSLDSTISTLTISDEVLVMLDEKQTAFGLIKASSDIAQNYVARLLSAQ